MICKRYSTAAFNTLPLHITFPRAMGWLAADLVRGAESPVFFSTMVVTVFYHQKMLCDYQKVCQAATWTVL